MHDILYLQLFLMAWILLFVGCEFFLKSNFPNILALCKTNLECSIDSNSVWVSEGYRHVINNSVFHVHSLAVYMKEGLPFASDLSLENSEDFYICFRLALLSSFSYCCFWLQGRLSPLIFLRLINVKTVS